MQAAQSMGHPSACTSSRGSPNGRSKAPTHEPGHLSQFEKADREAKRSRCDSLTHPLFNSPNANTMFFLAFGALEKSHPTNDVERSTGTAACVTRFHQVGGIPGSELTQARPMMEAVAISSSSRASDTWPDTEYGSSSGFSAYFSRIEALMRVMLTSPMVQPAKRRSEISS